MLIFSFVCSIVFTFIMVVFIIATIYTFFKQKKIMDESEKMINGFKVYDLEGGADEEKK